MELYYNEYYELKAKADAVARRQKILKEKIEGMMISKGLKQYNNAQMSERRTIKAKAVDLHEKYQGEITRVVPAQIKFLSLTQIDKILKDHEPEVAEQITADLKIQTANILSMR